jgi:hypothetical protein
MPTQQKADWKARLRLTLDGRLSSVQRASLLAHDALACPFLMAERLGKFEIALAPKVDPDHH